MKRLMMTSAVAALILGGGAQAAAPGGWAVQGQAAASYKLAPGEFDECAASYTLNGGGSIRFIQTAPQRFWASVKGGERVQLYAVSPQVFATAAGARIEFRDEGDSVVIDHYERLPVPLAMGAVNVRMIAAR